MKSLLSFGCWNMHIIVSDMQIFERGCNTFHVVHYHDLPLAWKKKRIGTFIIFATDLSSKFLTITSTVKCLYLSLKGLFLLLFSLFDIVLRRSLWCCNIVIFCYFFMPISVQNFLIRSNFHFNIFCVWWNSPLLLN